MEVKEKKGGILAVCNQYIGRVESVKRTSDSDSNLSHLYHFNLTKFVVGIKA